ncbi:major facilitator transporter [Colletotrichum kahawae]|uniref:Major facilitator transporter n=1 Tax=Colletotrichum kahawae TaxID=34407 RepID=A0AAE0D2D3_COLKA|nr:major facilitator transporter [Colletotrichum kahawae]
MSIASQVALASYGNMFSIGTAYALSIVQFEIPRLFKVSHEQSFAPFGAVSAGLAIGVATAASSISKNGARSAVGRSAIGPLGFSSGAAATFTLSSFLSFNMRGAEDIGDFLKIGGMTFVAVGAATQLLLPDDTTNGQPQSASSPLEKKSENFAKGTFWILLFFNALPGMVAFSVLLPGVSHYRSTDHGSPGNYLPYTMAALAGGGLLATPLNSFLGLKSIFVVLFSLRTMLLLALWQKPNQALALVTLCAILFAHGAGFSILPGLIKSRLVEPANFPREYGRVLTAWGAAGVVASGLNATVKSSSGDLGALSLAIGSLLLVAAVALVATPLGVKDRIIV